MPSTLPPAVRARVKVALLKVEFVIALEKVADKEELIATPVTPSTGDIAVTVGGVVSAFAPVVKCHV